MGQRSNGSGGRGETDLTRHSNVNLDGSSNSLEQYM